MKFIDLFAGIGGMRLAFEDFGTCVFSSEIDKKACDTYQLNFGERPHGDITKIDAKDIPDHDILLAGFPCQALSMAGKRLGFEDARGTMFFEIARILREKKPRAFLLENVKGLTHKPFRREFTTILNILDELGYNVEWKVLSSKGLVPQNRERVYIVGMDRIVNFLKFEWPILPDKGPPVKSILEDNADDKYTLPDGTWNHFQRKKEKYGHGKSGGFSYNILDLETYGRTLLTKDISNNLIFQEEKNPRQFTTRECARYQGFPETFKIPDNLGKETTYKQFGNSVAVPVVNRIAKQMMKALERVPFS